MADFPNSPVDGNTYIINGVTFLYRVTAGVGEFVAQATSSSSGTGNSIVYTDTLPATKVEGNTLFNLATAELTLTYNDGDSTQYLVYPMNGFGAIASGGGSSGGGTTDHSLLSNRGIVDQHPIAAITGLQAALDSKQATLVSGTSIKTINGTSILGSGNIVISGGGGYTPGDTIVRLDTIPAQNNNVPVFTAAGASQFLTTASTRAMMGLSTVANTIPLFTGTSSASLAVLTPFMVTMLEKTGVPTALQHLKITSGNGANGGWLRIGTGDTAGVQLCWHAIVCNSATTAQGAGYVGTDTTWTFPQVFNGLPFTAGFIQDGVPAWITNGASGNSSTTASFRQQSFNNGPGNTAATVVAIGFY